MVGRLFTVLKAAILKHWATPFANLLVTFLLILKCASGAVWLNQKVPSEFVPREDRGNFIMMQAAEGASFESNAENLKKMKACSWNMPKKAK